MLETTGFFLKNSGLLAERRVGESRGLGLLLDATAFRDGLDRLLHLALLLRLAYDRN